MTHESAFVSPRIYHVPSGILFFCAKPIFTNIDKYPGRKQNQLIKPLMKRERNRACGR
ncbi:hypothetical protein TSAR_013097 [Trichomalopsis sarcophagae]|uniref:Uncharacterized protein n=1 Tax=Trichomalopsis sarcophagae TaxID=543379 RepID=A0A232EF37_9HYME|nr:hypothetical protein TSAR_013097 [Trichomalopsis sarcophagae]